MLLFSLSAIVLVELSLACNIQIEENERAGAFQILAPFMLYCFQFSGEWFVKSGSYFSLKLSAL